MPSAPLEPASGRLNFWVAIDVAAAALGVTVKRAYKLALTDQWRRSQGPKPHGYLMHDINLTRTRRKAQP